MKRVLFAAAAILSLSLPAQGSGLAFVKAVANSAALEKASEQLEGRGFSLEALEMTGVIRCPGCFEYTARFVKNLSEGGEEKIERIYSTNYNFSSGEIFVRTR